MFIRLIVTISLMSSSRIIAMNNMTLPAQSINQEVTLVFGSEEKDSLVIPLEQARLFKLCHPYLENNSFSWPLAAISYSTGKHLVEQLERVCLLRRSNSSFQDSISHTLIERSIRDDFNKLHGSDLIALMNAADFLDIEELVRLAHDSLTFWGNPKRISSEDFELLPQEIRSELFTSIIERLIGLPQIVPIKGARNSQVTAVCVAPQDDHIIITGHSDGMIRIYNSVSEEVKKCKPDEKHTKSVTALCVTNDGDTIISGSKDGDISIWDSNARIKRSVSGHRGAITSLCVTADNKIVSAFADKTIAIWDIQGKLLGSWKGFNEEVTSVSVSSDNVIVAGFQDGQVAIFKNMEDVSPIMCEGHEKRISAVAVTGADKMVTASHEKTIRIWDRDGKLCAICEGHTAGVIGICVTPDNMIVSCGFDNTIQVWNNSGEKIISWHEGENKALSVCATSKGKIVSISHNGEVCIWDLENYLVLGRILSLPRDQALLLWPLLQEAPYDEAKIMRSYLEKIKKEVNRVSQSATSSTAAQ